MKGTKKSTIVIRKITRKDVNQMAELWQALADERKYIATEHVSRDQRNRWIKSVDDSGVLWAIAEIGGKMVGALSLARYGDWKKTGHLRILGMGVAKPFRGQGVGTVLMDYAINWARQRRVKKIALSVFSTNTKAIALYEKFGFVREGVRRKQFRIDGRYVDEIMMGLPL